MKKDKIIKAISTLNSLRLSWMHLSSKERKKYELDTNLAFYHTDTEPETIRKLVSCFNILEISEDNDFVVQETIMNENMMYTVGITSRAAKKLEKLGIEISKKLN